MDEAEMILVSILGSVLVILFIILVAVRREELWDSFKQWRRQIGYYKSHDIKVGATLLPRFKNTTKMNYRPKLFCGIQNGWEANGDEVRLPKSMEGLIIEVHPYAKERYVMARFGEHVCKFFNEDVATVCYIISPEDTHKAAAWKQKWGELMGGEVEPYIYPEDVIAEEVRQRW